MTDPGSEVPSDREFDQKEMQPRQTASVGGFAGFEPEADLQDDLVLGNLAVPDDAPLV
jgi:hypothetical protein